MAQSGLCSQSGAAPDSLSLSLSLSVSIFLSLHVTITPHILVITQVSHFFEDLGLFYLSTRQIIAPLYCGPYIKWFKVAKLLLKL